MLCEALREKDRAELMSEDASTGLFVDIYTLKCSIFISKLSLKPSNGTVTLIANHTFA